jgi:hypothetical protein
MVSIRKRNRVEGIPGKPEFHIRIHSRQNNCMQGELYWLNTGEKINFRSLLELVMLLQEAMDACTRPDLENIFRSWKMESSFNSELSVNLSANK